MCHSLPTEFKRREEAPEMGLRTESKQNPNTDHTQSSHQHLTVHSNTSNQSNKGWVYLDDHKRHPLCKVLEVIDRSIRADTYLYFGCYLEKFRTRLHSCNTVSPFLTGQLDKGLFTKWSTSMLLQLHMCYLPSHNFSEDCLLLKKPCKEHVH